MRTLLLAATGAALIAAFDVHAAPPHDELRSNSHGWNGRLETGAHEHYPGCRHERHRERRYEGRHEGRHHGRYERYERRGHHRARAVDQARWYARKSVDQAREARRLGVHFDHPRWSLSYNRHFEWALRADAYELEREVRRRARKLREIRSYGYARHGGITVYPARPYRH